MGNDTVSKAQAGMLYGKSKEAGMTDEELANVLTDVCGVTKTWNVPREKCDDAVKAILAFGKHKKAPGQQPDLPKTPAEEAAQVHSTIRSYELSTLPTVFMVKSIAIENASLVVSARIRAGAKVSREDLFELADQICDWLNIQRGKADEQEPVPPPPDEDNIAF